MARGWDSKSVESQIESAQPDPAIVSRGRLTPEQAAALRKRESLLLARTRLLDQLQTCQHPRHRALLERALAELEKALGQSAGAAKPAAQGRV
ncbi:MAG: hypothetical protein LAP13_22830 [Acidobacteriia bacterium]|nr:hypothetical protein [Terriglobia bacterium]